MTSMDGTDRSETADVVGLLNADNGGLVDMHTFNFGKPCRANQLVTTSGGFGSW